MSGLARRLLTSRGYGVHSPLAFRFIREALRRNGATTYYGLRALSAGLPRGERCRVERLWRVACFVKASTTAVFGNAPEVHVKALTLPVAGIGGDRTMLLAAAGADVREVVAAAVSPCCVAVTDMTLWPALEAALPGLAFASRSEGYIICRKGLTPTACNLNFS